MRSRSHARSRRPHSRHQRRDAEVVGRVDGQRRVVEEEVARDFVDVEVGGADDEVCLEGEG